MASGPFSQLSICGVTAFGLRTLLASGSVDDAGNLDLRGNPLGDAGLQALLDHPRKLPDLCIVVSPASR